MISIAWKWIERHGIRAFAAIALAALTVTLACFNVNGWLAAGLGLLAVLAACFEAIGFVFAVLTEDAVRRWRLDRALVCLVILGGSAAFNTVGGHRAWDASMATRLDHDRQQAQTHLDAQRAALQLASANADAEIARAPMPDPSETPQRQAEARATWAMTTLAPRQRKDRAERDLAALPVVATVNAEFPDAVVWGFLAFLEVAKALGLWAIGMNPAVGAIRRRIVEASAPAPASEEYREHADAWDASEAARRLVSLRRDRQPVGA